MGNVYGCTLHMERSLNSGVYNPKNKLIVFCLSKSMKLLLRIETCGTR